MDSQAECWEDGLLAGASTRSQLLSWEELFGGWLTTLCDNESQINECQLVYGFYNLTRILCF